MLVEDKEKVNGGVITIAHVSLATLALTIETNLKSDVKNLTDNKREEFGEENPEPKMDNGKPPLVSP